MESSKRKVVNKLDDKGVVDVKAKQIVKRVKNKMDSPFISVQKEWSNKEHFTIPEDLLKGITEGLDFKRPSKI